MTEYVNVPAFLEGDYALRVKGDKAAPDILDGDLIVVRKTDNADGARFAVLDTGEGYTVRKLPVDGSLLSARVRGVVTGLVRSLA